MSSRISIRWLQHETAVWTVGVLAAVMGHGAGAALLESIEGRRDPALAFWLIGFALATTVFYVAYANPVPRRLPAKEDFRILLLGWKPWMVAAATALALYGSATGVHRLISAGEYLSIPIFAGYLTIMVALTIWLYTLRDDIVIIRTRSMQARGSRDTETAIDSEGVRSAMNQEHGPTHLIWTLSSIPEPLASKGCLPAIEWSDPPDPEADLKAIQSSATPRWPWAMLLRGLVPHSPSLKDLILICSRKGTDPKDESNPSLPQAAIAARWIRHYPSLSHLTVSVWAVHGGRLKTIPAGDRETLAASEGFGFSDFNDLSGAYSDLLKYLRFIRHVPSRRILIDFTGGMKPPSVVAAAVTFRGEVATQYVDTNSLKATTYDLKTNPEVRTY